MNGNNDWEYDDDQAVVPIGVLGPAHNINVPQELSKDTRQKNLHILVDICRNECQKKGQRDLQSVCRKIFYKLMDPYAAVTCGFGLDLRSGVALLSTWDLQDDLINKVFSFRKESYNEVRVEVMAAYGHESEQRVPM